MSLKTFVRIADSLHASTDCLIYGTNEHKDTDKTGILELIQKCNDRELKLAEEILKLLVTYVR